MVCEKCRYKNSEYDIICEKCGSPLNIEKNIELQKKYNHKPRAIDIEEITPDQYKIEFANTKKKVRLALIIFIILSLIFLSIFTIIMVEEVRTNDILTKYNEFVDNSDIGILYLGKDNEINTLLSKYAEDYELDYLYISTSKITAIKKNRIKSRLNLNKSNSAIVILDNGKVITSLDNCKNSDSVNEFLKKNNIIPHEIGEPNKVINAFDESLKSQEPVIVYIANNKNDSNMKHNNQLKKFCNDYSINYTFIEGYYLTDNQKLKILKKLNYSDIHNEIVAIIDEGQIKEVSENVSDSKKEYFELASNYGIIDISSSQSLKAIDYNRLKDLVISKEKNIIVLGSKNCQYCERLKPIIGKIGIQNNIPIYYYEPSGEELSSVEDYLLALGYKEGKLSPPLIIITENNQLLDYIIGLSDKSLYEEKFIELGVIR